MYHFNIKKKYFRTTFSLSYKVIAYVKKQWTQVPFEPAVDLKNLTDYCGQQTCVEQLYQPLFVPVVSNKPDLIHP